MTVPKSYWETVEDKAEWVSFEEGIPIDVILQDCEPEEVSTTWGSATVLTVWQFPKGELLGGIPKYLRITSKRLVRGIRNATPSGIPQDGCGYRIIRTGEGFKTTYNVTFLGKFLVTSGKAKKLDDSQSAISDFSGEQDNE